MTRSLTPEDAAAAIDAGATVVDVRDADEYEAGHIAGATHIPFENLQAEAAALDQGERLILYCRTGDRSGAAVDAFAASGYDAVNIEGGLEAWAEAGQPLEPPDGSVAERSQLPPK